jgi:hypothetical protein
MIVVLEIPPEVKGKTLTFPESLVVSDEVEMPKEAL